MNENNVRTNITITPQGSISICKTQLENDYKNQLTFSSATTQLEYFETTIEQVFSDYTYIKKDNTVNVGINIDEIINCNYLFYTNTGFTTKTYYCFITNMQYINENCTKITFETDCFQTYQFDIVYVNTFIEREHVTDDTVGANTIPENVETGEYVINAHLLDSYNNNLTCVVESTVTPGELVKSYGGIYNNIPSGITYYRFDTITGTNGLQSFLNLLANNGKSDALTGIFLAPKWLAGGDTSITIIPNNTNVGTFDLGISKISTLDGYTPKNKKLLTYPYVYINLSNGQGANAIYHQELWTAVNNEMIFRVYGCLTPGCSIRGIPINYKDIANPYDEGLNLGKFPQINWVTDQFTNWLTQNGISLGNAIGYNMTNAVVGAMGDNVSGITSGVNGIMNTISEIYKHSLVPLQVEGNLNSGDVTTASGNNRFHCYKMTIRNQFARIIDSYFDMFGYKVNTVKTPSIHTRSNWNFIKTIDCNLEGNIPQTDLNILKTMFNNGVTFWHDPTKMYDYTQTNSILT